ncbi:hypothetical protein CEXT_287671 [Caerostris extrusa]|uniref:Uncharacterized protein n=1 Tax=Caerostris extrusa TaxID=172846 RepID=A0AAV4NCG6_CAEEX|nr:hypothetical protein CEXT_287671 [Caerostris extrusa]
MVSYRKVKRHCTNYGCKDRCQPELAILLYETQTEKCTNGFIETNGFKSLTVVRYSVNRKLTSIAKMMNRRDLCLGQKRTRMNYKDSHHYSDRSGGRRGTDIFSDLMERCGGGNRRSFAEVGIKVRKLQCRKRK